MINNPQVRKIFPKPQSQVEWFGRPVTAYAFGRTALATTLMVAAIAALAITSLIQSNQGATANSGVSIQAAQSVPATPFSVPLDSGEVGPFAFGYLVFEDDPANGIRGFGPLPSGVPAP
jgi:hypothetical protein